MPVTGHLQAVATRALLILRTSGPGAEPFRDCPTLGGGVAVGGANVGGGGMVAATDPLTRVDGGTSGTSGLFSFGHLGVNTAGCDGVVCHCF